MNKKVAAGTTQQAVATRRPAKKTTVRAPKQATGRVGAADAAARSTLFVNSVEKAMTVLKAFDASRPRLTLSQIATLADMDLSGAQRFTYTLLNLGYLDKDEETKTYSLSPQVFDLSYHYLSSNELVNRAAPYVQQLSMHTGETANVTVLHGSDIVFVYRIASPQVLISSLNVGARMPAYCAAPGLAMLAHLPEAEVDAILAASDLVKHTPHTVAQPRAIKQRLAEIRKAGYAHTEEEYFLGDISTAAAVLDARGRVMGAVNVAVAKPRWNGAADEQRIADLVISTASAISSR
jgi:IclR family transcriptional regulator, pca regulon regulatory protein